MDFFNLHGYETLNPGWPGDSVGRGHSMIVDHGWMEGAEYSLSWLNKQGL
jgi:hypothetical protein